MKTTPLHFVLTVLLLLIMADTARSQDADSFFAVPQGRTRYTTADGLLKTPDRWKSIDTLLNRLHQFDTGYLHNLGNPGTPVFSLN